MKLVPILSKPTITIGIPTLGDTFLRAAYVVYDQENRNLHLAQAADCGSNVVVIGTGPDAVPSSTGMCPASSTVAATCMYQPSPKFYITDHRASHSPAYH